MLRGAPGPWWVSQCEAFISPNNLCMDPHVSTVGNFMDKDIMAFILKLQWGGKKDSEYRVQLTALSGWNILGPLREEELDRVARLLQQAREFIEQRFDEYPVGAEMARTCEPS